MAAPETLAQALRMLGAEYDREITDGLVDVWETMFGTVDDEALKAGVRSWLATERVFPKASDLLARVQSSEPLCLEADQAWERVLACREYSPETGGFWSAGRVRSELGLAAHMAVLEAGGYPQLALLGDGTALFWARKRFVEAYVRLRVDGHPALPPARAPERLMARSAS